MLASDSASGNPFLALQVAALTIGDAGAPGSFSTRLATENGWPVKLADRVVAEYRRFLILLATSTEDLAPSELVDRAWHLHLLYTRSYWDDLCRDTLGRPLHHQPSVNCAEEVERLSKAYQRTLECYETEFAEKRPLDIWPESFLPGDDSSALSISRRLHRKNPIAWFGLHAVISALAIVAVGIFAELLFSGECLTPAERSGESGVMLVSLFIAAVIIATVHGKPGTRREPYSESP